ncbi:sensor domain-containing diguanylate cyclase [Novosphingobium sp. M1R2S20]|uniref:GAF domain-containing protein n=1 Tax=Novosphingobium rhizovicinum TaxID=3228928 RepID=A0ABV3R6N4_9SPHN
MQTQNGLAIEMQGMASRRILLTLLHVVCIGACALALFGHGNIARAGAGMALLIIFGMFIATLVFSRSALAEVRMQITNLREAQDAKQQVEELFAMTDMLQAAEDHEDAGAILMATTRRLLPEFGGALYVFNNSRDRLDLTKSWNESEGFLPVSSLLPSTCWALKRGKPHINALESGTLTCLHQIGSAATVEVPMMARGQVFGLIVLATEAEDAFHRLYKVRRVARALADSMSLALSNIALREKLRTQSLRDPLTGLYNRRYMEDALERYISLAERQVAPRPS